MELTVAVATGRAAEIAARIQHVEPLNVVSRNRRRERRNAIRRVCI